MTGQIRACRAASVAWTVGLSAIAFAADSPGSPSYNRDVRPILAEHCSGCHGQDTGMRKAGLRLDRFSDASSKLPSGATAIVPGEAKASEMIRRVTSAVDRMPPPKAGRALTPAEIDTLSRWINNGAEYEPLWAYIRPARPAVPDVRDASWPKNPIDCFVLARLEKEGLAPSPEADAYTLIRRLSFDLTGLPPTLEEADAFANDTRPNRVAWAVDGLLARAAYGEHMGRHWLDLARYADSNGYHIDTKRSMWPYRDWVIGAFNRNMPFDQFTVEQLAGDLLPDATVEQRIATGFHRNTLFNEEGGIDPEEFRTKAVVDRVDTTMTVWMGTTMGCAECHDHKYDPFSQKEFYRLYAFFNNVPELGGGTGNSMAPLVSLPPDDTKRAEIESLRSVIANLEKEQVKQDASFREKLPVWAETLSGRVPTWTPLIPKTAQSDKGSSLEILPDGSIFATGELPEPFIDTYTVEAAVRVRKVTAFAVEVLPEDRLPAGGPGRADDGAFVLTELEVSLGPGGARLPLRDARAVFEGPERQPEKAIDGDPGFKSGWSTGTRAGTSDSLVVTVEHGTAVEPETPLRVKLTQRLSKHTLGRFRLWVTDAPRDPDLPAPHVAHLLQIPAKNWTPAQTEAAFEYYRSRQPERVDRRLAALRAKIDALERSAPTSLVMAEMETPRETRIHIRGNFLDLGEAVSTGVPQVWHDLEAPTGKQPNRLDLVRWLVSEENPLTARVTVNRLWAILFGQGLVETVDDFGTRGALPTHPELLDYLATELVASGWDIKALVRLMVTSATYRQSSSGGAALYERDPRNALLARGPRFRLDAECIRDGALAASGLLVNRVGGPSVFPYQPPGLWEEKQLTGYQVGVWPVIAGDGLYRRSVYTFRRRSVPYPTFQTFDAPSFEYCVANRLRTNTPLQALTTLNGPQFIEAARVLAQRVLTEAPSDIEKQVTAAFRLCLTRPPSDRERAHLRSLYEHQLEVFSADPDEAERLGAAGRSPAAEGLPHARVAAWTVVANVLLNLDENLTKG